MLNTLRYWEMIAGLTSSFAFNNIPTTCDTISCRQRREGREGGEEEGREREREREGRRVGGREREREGGKGGEEEGS